MDPLHIRVTTQSTDQVLGCPRCQMALLPREDLPRVGQAMLDCPLCGFEQLVSLVEVGEGFPFNLAQQREDIALSPLYRVDSIVYDEDLCLVDIPDLLDDPAYYALQDGVAPVESFGWVAGEGLLGQEGYRLLLVVRVKGELDDNTFRLEFPAEVLGDLARLADDETLVLVSQRKGVLFAEAGEIYLESVREAGGSPGEPLALNSWASLEE